MYIKEFLALVVHYFFETHPTRKSLVEVIRDSVLRLSLDEKVNDVYVLLALSHLVFRLNVPLKLTGPATEKGTVIQALADLSTAMDPQKIPADVPRIFQGSDEARVAPLVMFIKSYEIMRVEVLRVANLYGCSSDDVCDHIRPALSTTDLTLSDTHPIMVTSRLTMRR